MIAGNLKQSGRDLERLFSVGTLVGCDEAVLLRRFAQDGDHQAFSVLVERYGPMVWNLCRSILRHPHDADDAFQATFLVLARRAGQIDRPEQLSCWLHGVAVKVSKRALAERIRRSDFPKVPNSADPAPAEVEVAKRELVALLHVELARLPEKYRNPLVLCHLEGLTHEAAASQLGWPVGTVRGRLSRGRDLLRQRFERRGMSLALAIPGARSLLPPSLVAKTMQHVMRLAGDAGRLGTISTSVFNLVHGVTFMMSVTKSVHLVGVMSLAAGMVVLGAGWSGFGGQTPPPGETSEKVTGQEVLPETKPIPQEKISERRANLHSQVDQLEADLIVEQIELEDARKAYEQFMAFKRTANPESREHLVEAKLVTLESEKSKLMEQRSQLVRKVRVPSDPSLERLTNRIHEVDTAIASAEDQAKKNLIESSKNKQFELRHILTEMSISLAEKKRHLAELQTNLADLPAVKSVVQGPKRTQIGDYLIIDVLEALPGRPIQGSRLVRSDGTISLGFYGDLEVVGKTRREIKVDLIGHLQKYLNDAVLGLIEMDADSGKLQDVEPANSDRVVVDDEFEPPKTHESDAKKLDRVLKEISDLQLIQLRKMNSTPQGGKKSDPPDEE